MFTNSWTFPWPVEEHQSEYVLIGGHDARDRQERIPGFSSDTLSRLRVLLIGCGGLNCWNAIALAKKGAGLDLVDPDEVEVHNTSRQLYQEDDLFKPKAHCLAKHAAEFSTLGSICRGHQVGFDETSWRLLAQGVHVVVCGVDNDACRRLASVVFRQRGIPVIFSGLDDQHSRYGYVFVQETEACLGCQLPHIAHGEERGNRCVPSPAVIDALLTLSGITLYALDSLFMARDRHWNFRSVDLSGQPNLVGVTKPRPGCELCGADA